MKRVILALFLTSILVGCASVPDEVKNDMSSYRNEERKGSEDIGFTYVNVSELAETSEAALNKEYTQFRISDKVTLDDPKEIYLMSFERINIADSLSNWFENTMSLFFTSSELNKQQAESIIENDESYIMLDNIERKVYRCVGDDGFIAMLKPEVYDISFSYNEPNVKIYHADRKDNLSDEYQLKDGKCSVGDAVEYINSWLKNEYHKFSPEYDYKVETVIVREHEGNYLYQILVQAFYKDIPLDSYTREHEIKDGEFTGKTLYTDYAIQIQMVSANEIASFTNLSGIYKPTEIEKIDDCISLESALEFCENTFTDFKDVTISDIDIMYTINPVYDESDPDNLFVVGYTSHPVWAFIIDVPPEEFVRKGEVNTYGDIRKYIYIDMLTGELNYNLDITYRQ